MMKIFIIMFSCVFLVLAAGCGIDDEVPAYRIEMRNFVQDISSYAHSLNSSFIVIPQNGHELLTVNGDDTGDSASEYIDAIDGIGREDLYYGYTGDNAATPAAERDYMIAFMDIAETEGIEVLVTDYCRDPPLYTDVNDSYNQNELKGYISFAAEHRELDIIPDYPADPWDFNYDDVISLAEAENFLYLLNPSDNTADFPDKEAFLSVLQATDYDVLIIDLFFNGTQSTILSPAEVNSLKLKDGGGDRLVIAYMSIGEAEDYRYYWQSAWDTEKPAWMAGENPNWPGNYKVRYWDENWQDIIFGNDSSYLKMIIDAGFDGVYLDIIDAYEYFEEQ